MTGYVLNGRFVRGRRLTVDVDAPHFAYGHGLFETLLAHRGTPCFLREHVARMRASAELLEIPADLDESVIRVWIHQLLREVSLAEARIKVHLLVTRTGTDVLVTAEGVAAPDPDPAPVRIDRAHPRFNGLSAMSGMKTMNYMTNRLALQEGQRRGFDEVVFTLPDDTVLEGSRSTVFAVFGRSLRTTPLTLPILPGITRSIVLRLAAELGLDVVEEPFSFAELATTDEAFITGSVSGVRPVGWVGEHSLPPAPGPWSRRLIDAYLVRLEAEASREAGSGPGAG